MSGKKGMRHYPQEVKLEAVRLFFEEGMTRAEIIKALGLHSVGRVEVWMRQYRREGIAAFTQPIGRPRKVSESAQAELARLRMENTLLKNTIPNCARKCWRSAISGYLQTPRRIPSKSDVSLLRDFASRLLRMGQALQATRQGC